MLRDPYSDCAQVTKADDYVGFTKKQKTKHFGINVNFSVFQNNPLPMWEGQNLSTVKLNPV